MKYIEHRRHAQRIKPSSHLSKEGLSIARKVGESIGAFDHVVCSPLIRSKETAIAMGFQVSEEVELLAVLEAGQGLLTNIQNYILFLTRIKKFIDQTIDKLPENGRLLIISHGGVVEASATACLKSPKYILSKYPISYCEGISWEWVGGKYINPCVLRV